MASDAIPVSSVDGKVMDLYSAKTLSELNQQRVM
jgi:hypothetical protein